ncbi:hypothetical protein V2H45_17950 [Tumidithrix elongata RA019]|uniref:Transposase n=1 Tax=Tumidithrix elongata BACA0141 TaxID=2716417 RepID=A0AAW9Q5Y4_9CYAN|nr:hypothetical protein [Tumidithrix elongata RA019]
MRIQQIISDLKQPFPVSDHQECISDCGTKWFYIPWQKIRDRLDRICPEWQVSYSDPIAVSGYITVRCMLTVAGVTREATGSDKAYQLANQSNNFSFNQRDSLGLDVSRHLECNPDRAMINAFVNAAAQFGIGDYLNDAQFMARYLQRQPQLPSMIESHSICLAYPKRPSSSANSRKNHHSTSQDLRQQTKKAEMMEVTQILRKLNKKHRSPLRIGLNFLQSATPKPRTVHK